MAERAKGRSKEDVSAHPSTSMDTTCAQERSTRFARPANPTKSATPRASSVDANKRKRGCEDSGQEECASLLEVRKVGNSMREVLFESASRMSKANTSVLLERISDMENLILTVMLENERLKGQLSECRVSEDRNAKEKETLVRSYASVTSSAGRVNDRNVVRVNDENVASTPPPRVVTAKHALVVRPRLGDMTSAEVKERVMTEVRPLMNDVRINAMRKVRNGGIAIEAASAEELKRLKECSRFRDVGLTVDAPRKIGPKVIIYDVPNEWTANAILLAVYERNLTDVCTKEEYKERVRMVSRGGKKDSDVGNVVLEMSRRMCERLVENGRMYVEWRALKVRPFEVVYRCYGCYGFGHSVRECKLKERVCKKCGKVGHRYVECRNECERCRNCAERKVDANHSVMSDKCPEYVRALERMRERISNE